MIMTSQTMSNAETGKYVAVNICTAFHTRILIHPPKPGIYIIHT